jgi:hypothetical protein
MSDQLTSLLTDLQRLTQQLKTSMATGDQHDNQKDKEEVRLLEGQIQTRDADTVLASKLKSAIVSSPDEKRIGEVNDLIISAGGNVEGIVIGVADDKNIALKLDRFKLTPELDGCARIMLGATQEELQQAPGSDLGLEQKPEEKSEQMPKPPNQ